MNKPDIETRFINLSKQELPKSLHDYKNLKAIYWDDRPIYPNVIPNEEIVVYLPEDYEHNLVNIPKRAIICVHNFDGLSDFDLPWRDMFYSWKTLFSGCCSGNYFLLFRPNEEGEYVPADVKLGFRCEEYDNKHRDLVSVVRTDEGWGYGNDTFDAYWKSLTRGFSKEPRENLNQENADLLSLMIREDAMKARIEDRLDKDWTMTYDIDVPDIEKVMEIAEKEITDVKIKLVSGSVHVSLDPEIEW